MTIQVTGVTLCLGLASLGYGHGSGDFHPAVGNEAAILVQHTKSLGEKSQKPQPPEPAESEELFDSFDPVERARLQKERRPMACAVLSMPEEYYGQGFCVLQTRYPVEDIVVEKLISRAGCHRGITYGLKGHSVIWFDKGCRLTLRIKTRKGASLSGKTIDCQNFDFQRTPCPTKLRIHSMTMVEDYSRRDMCRNNPIPPKNNWAYDNHWGFKDDQVWVSQGCRGRFYVEGNAP